MVTALRTQPTHDDPKSSKLPEIETEVLIVGAGVAGLSFAAMLAALDIKVFAIAKHSGTAPAPRAHVTNQRTMEVFRDMGIEERIQGAGTCMPEIGNMVMATSLTGMEIGRYNCYGGGDHQLTDFAKASPSKMWNTAQNNMEPILLHRAREKGADIRFYHELIDIQQSDEGVVARVRERTSQGEYIVRAHYAVAADGARSTVAQKLGFGFIGEPGLMHMISSWVEMDLAQYVAHRPACIYLMLQPGDAYWVGSGTCILKKPWDEWVVNRQYNAADGEPDMSDEAIIAHARSALAIPDSLPIRVKHKGKWQVNHVVATEYRQGRVFLAGDAAHRHPPASGLGSNTCVQDAYNLSWKLAAVIKGQAGEGILESYNQERQPIGKQIVDHAIETLHDMAALPGALGFERGQSRDEGFAKLNELFSDADGAADRRETLRKTIDRGNRRSNPLGVHLGQRYANSVAVVDDGTPFPEYERDPVLFYHPTTHPGAHIPHAWIELNKKRISVLDIFEHGCFGLVVGIGGEAWKEAAAVVSQELGVKLPVYFVGQCCMYSDVLGEWTSRREVSDRGALLVRPDRHIGWRSFDRPQNPTAVLRSALQQVLSRK
ncbi:FAD binding domain-containing protein [Fusarium acuminatum]|uniref:FAD binding domain-containing protein n=1 Tax=Fusarium acuminatum TaxID=5515 RepID=A0ABZ2X1R0_9HYPO